MYVFIYLFIYNIDLYTHFIIVYLKYLRTYIQLHHTKCFYDLIVGL